MKFVFAFLFLICFSAQASSEYESKAQAIYKKLMDGQLPEASEEIQFYSGRCYAINANWDENLNVWAVVAIVQTDEGIKTAMSISYTDSANPNQSDPYKEYSREKLSKLYSPHYTTEIVDQHFLTQISQDPPIFHLIALDQNDSHILYAASQGRGQTYCQMEALQD